MKAKTQKIATKQPMRTKAVDKKRRDQKFQNPEVKIGSSKTASLKVTKGSDAPLQAKGGLAPTVVRELPHFLDREKMQQEARRFLKEEKSGRIIKA